MRTQDLITVKTQPKYQKDTKMPLMLSTARHVVWSAAACLFGLPAFAADLPPRPAPTVPAPYTPVVVAPLFTWTGFYLGGELGWIQTKPDYIAGAVLPNFGGTPVTSLPVSDKNGATYGVLAGFNYQVGSFVFGVEGDFAGWSVGTIRTAPYVGDFITAHSKWGGSIRGRLGVAADRALFYVTGGGAFVSNETTATGTDYSIGGGGTRWGWTLGGGLDYAFTTSWFAGVEYRYTQYESKTFTYPLNIVNNLGIVGFKQELSTNQVTGRIGYKF